MKVTLPDGTTILAQGRLGRIPSARPRCPDFALYLDRRWADDPEVTWPFQIVDWPDFGLPADEEAVFTAVGDLSRRAHAGELVEVGCYGGLGRTGTVLGWLAILAGVPPASAVAWVRSHYHQGAIESAAQEQLISRFAGRLAP